MTAASWLSVASLAVVIINLGGLAFLMRRLPWFRPVGWIGIVWMIHAVVFLAATLANRLIGSSLTYIEINTWSSSLRLQAYFSLTAVLFFIGAEWQRGRRS
jgi:hypothetical protein